jgi:hypothetical protein
VLVVAVMQAMVPTQAVAEPAAAAAVVERYG